MNITHSVVAVQASTNTNTLVTDSILRASRALSVSFTIRNTGLNSIQWNVLAGNASDLSDGVVVQSAATVTANGASSYAVQVAPYKFYGVQIESTVDGNHGEGTILGIAKG